MSRSAQRTPSRRTRIPVAGGLALAGVLLMGVAQAGPSASEPLVAAEPELSSPSPWPGPRPTAEPDPPDRADRADRERVRDRTTGPVLPESDPVAVSVPRIGVRSTLVDLGLDEDGAMEVPRDPARAGWFSSGAAPGALGPAVIAGHVTWNGAPGVFHRLGVLRRDDQVRVTRRDGRTAVFTVTRVARFPKAQFPTHEVYGAIDHAGLRLITCGGGYDAVRHRYPDNVVVFARLTAVRGSRG